MTFNCYCYLARDVDHAAAFAGGARLAACRAGVAAVAGRRYCDGSAAFALAYPAELNLFDVVVFNFHK